MLPTGHDVVTHMVLCLLLLLASLVPRVTSARTIISDPDEPLHIHIDGTIMLGGLFPMHEKGTEGNQCGAIKEEKGIQRVEAMLLSIDAINRDQTLLPGITLGAHILDTCLRDTFALEQSMDYIKAHMSTLDVTDYTCSNGMPPRYRPSKAVAGVIGAAASPVSIMVASILRLFKIPQISYASTGIELSDKSRFEYFSRVVPPDTYQAQAMVDVVKAFGWSYVSTVADEGNYGEKGIAAFESRAESSGLCIARSLKIPREVKENTFKRVLQELHQSSKAKVVVLFVNEDNCRKLIRVAIEQELIGQFYFLASDSWGAKMVPVNGQEWAAEGTVTILPQREVLSDFDTYFKRLNPFNNTRNPWFREFWESHFSCSFSEISDQRVCTGHERLSAPAYRQEGVVPFVVDAVYAMAHALHDMIEAKCAGRPFCPEVNPPRGPELLQYIRNVSFVAGPSKHLVKFNENGDAQGRYTVYQFQRTPAGGYKYMEIGVWADILTINQNLTKWFNHDHSVPKSVCSEPCEPGYIKKNEEYDSCCWVCIKCTDYEILKNEVTCEQCPNGSYPDSSKQKCIGLPVMYMTFDSVWAVVPVVFSSFGILSVIFICVVFVKFNSTPVIMASGRELCYVLMVGLLLCYTMTVVMVAKPRMITCCLMRIGLGLSLSICYAALFTKTNRISRIFNRGVKAMVKRPSYTSPRSQLVICLCLVSVQIIGAITWVGMELPGTTFVFPDRKTVVLRCKSNNVAIVLSLLYNMVLIIMCTVYAFKTRKIPENFNEAKYIAFTMYSTCIVWLAFIPIYFGTNKSDFRIQITALCMCVSISATVVLGCMFVPKVYIVLYQPHKNVRQGSHGIGGLAGASRAFFGRGPGRFSSLSAMNGDITSPSNDQGGSAEGGGGAEGEALQGLVVVSCNGKDVVTQPEHLIGLVELDPTVSKNAQEEC